MFTFEDFERFLKAFQKLVEDLERQIEEDLHRITSEMNRSYYYGLGFAFGPNGRPIVREFGNVRRGMGRIEVVDEMDPLTDIVEEDGKIKVIVDMPGVEKDDIRIRVSEDGRSLTIEARGKERKYHKEIRLPAQVNSNNAKATYKNGVLSIELEKVSRRKGGVEIRID